jgi:hypothetical protein
MSVRNVSPRYGFKAEILTTLIIIQQEVSRPIHNGHTFGMIAATDDEATISRLSPTSSTLGVPPSPATPGSRTFQLGPLNSPELTARSALTSPSQPGFVHRTNSEPAPPPPTRPRIVAENTLPARTPYHCDACNKPITSTERLHCTE